LLFYVVLGKAEETVECPVVKKTFFELPDLNLCFLQLSLQRLYPRPPILFALGDVGKLLL
jgi:hypothetical protein